MNKLYILGALLFSAVEAGKLTQATATALNSYISAMTLGAYTYTVSGDCFSAGTATTLGMNNKYYQYYTFDIAAGSKSFAAGTPISTS